MLTKEGCFLKIKAINRRTNFNAGFCIGLMILVLTVRTGIAKSLPIQGVSSNCLEVRSWVNQHFAQGVVPPFSFIYGGKSSGTFIRNWSYHAEKSKTKTPDTEEEVYTYSDSQSGLIVQCTVTLFTDFPAVEWVLKFTNTSGKNSPILEKATVIDQDFNAEGDGSFILHHSKGSNGSRDDFKPIDDYLDLGKNIYFTPVGGRSSGTSALPFFNIEMPGRQGILQVSGGPENGMLMYPITMKNR